MLRICETRDCGKEASLECPTCKKLGIQGSYFCSQPCFKTSWKEHKLVHAIAETTIQPKKEEDSNGYNPWPDFQFSGKLRPFPQTPKRKVPNWIDPPDYAESRKGIPESEEMIRGSTYIKVLNEKEIEGMRRAGRLARECFDEVAKCVDVGITTDEIDRLVHEAIIERGCYPSTLNYRLYPKSCCTSVNEIICLGVPDTRPLQDGDICNIDVSLYCCGLHAGVNETFLIGNVSEDHKNLVKVTHESLMKAIEIVRPGTKYRQIGNVIQGHVDPHGYSVVKCYYGHGIHHLFHTAPKISHFAKNNTVGVMKAGHCFTIEPMISQGASCTLKWPDGWTAATADGLYSAQFEHTILVTEDGCEVLTKRPQNNGKPWFMDKI